MFNYTNVQTELDESSWNDSIKQKIKTVLPQTGQFVLSYLSTQLSATGSQNQAQLISDLLSLEPKWYSRLNSGNTDGIAEEIAQIAEEDSGIKNAALLAIILDIRSNPVLNSKVTADLSSVMSLIEIQYFADLPESSAIVLVSARLNHLLEFCDVYMEVKRYCYYRSIDEIDYELLKKIEQSLVTNQLVVGDEPIVIGAESFEPTIQNWLKDFVDRASDATGQDTFNIASYMSASEPAKKINNLEQSALTSVIKLYTWLHQPNLNPAEIEVYEAHRKIISPSEFLAGGNPQSQQMVQSAPVSVSEPIPATPSFKIPTMKDLDLSTRERSGLIFDQKTNVDLDEESKIRAEEKRNQSAIQAKLEALKRRSGVDEEHKQ